MRPCEGPCEAARHRAAPGPRQRCPTESPTECFIRYVVRSAAACAARHRLPTLAARAEKVQPDVAKAAASHATFRRKACHAGLKLFSQGLDREVCFAVAGWFPPRVFLVSQHAPPCAHRTPGIASHGFQGRPRVTESVFLKKTKAALRISSGWPVGRCLSCLPLFTLFADFRPPLWSARYVLHSLPHRHAAVVGVPRCFRSGYSLYRPDSPFSRQFGALARQTRTRCCLPFVVSSQTPTDRQHATVQCRKSLGMKASRHGAERIAPHAPEAARQQRESTHCGKSRKSCKRSSCSAPVVDVRSIKRACQPARRAAR